MIYLLASIFMLADHIGRIYIPGAIILTAIGRLAYPLFAWAIARGYKVTKSFKNYVLRLLLISVISQVPYALLFNNNQLNVCFTLLAGLICLKIYNSRFHAIIKCTTILSILLLSELCHLEYEIYGLLVIIAFYKYGEKDISILLQFLLTLMYTIIKRIDPVQLIASLSPILLLFLKDKDFKINRFIRYSFYPSHLIALYLPILLHLR